MGKAKWIGALTALLCGLWAGGCAVAAEELETRFKNPSEESKPWCYWYWLKNDVTAEGITKDLESMAKVGISRAMIGDVSPGSLKEGPVKMLSSEWVELKEHAFREAARVGVEIYMFNAPGWSQSGGPWIKPKQSMRRVAWQEFEATGGTFSQKVRPAGVIDASQDIAVLAVPRKDSVSVEGVVAPEAELLSLMKSQWIWHPSENGAANAPVGTRYFSRVIDVDPGELQSATIRLTADNIYALSVNGKELARDEDWKSVEEVEIKQHLKRGANTIRIAVTNPEKSPAGLIAAVQLKQQDGRTQVLVSDRSWLASKSPEESGAVARELCDIRSGPWAKGMSGEASGNKGTRRVFICDEEITARGLLVYGKAKGSLYALRNGERERVANINATGGRPQTDFLPNGVETFSFKDTTASTFEFLGSVQGKVVLTSEPTVAQVVEKQMGRMHPTPSPTWESYIFPDSVEPGEAGAAVTQKEILDLSDKLGADGVLRCTLPQGNWTVMAFGMVTTGAKNTPAAPEATGLEVDKMSREHTQYHFEAYIGDLLDKLTPEERKVFTGITIDSYEVGAQNWTDGFAAEFEKRNGYSPIHLLPVFTGRVVDSAKTSDQFLWDLRRTIADMIAQNYVGGLREAAHREGMTLWCENYGHWGFPGEFSIYGGYADEVSGEFWTHGLLGKIECRAASSAGHTYGKQRVYAEAYTARLDFGSHPHQIKRIGEQMFCEGVNHFVLHVVAHQPRDGVPGRNPRFGTQFHRNTPWFNEARDWVTYLQRCHTLLQEGRPSAEVAVYIGDFAPQMTGPRNPVPAEYDYDYIGSDAILRTLDVHDGEWVVYDENDSSRIYARWSALAMPQVKYIRPQVKARLEELRQKGGRILDGVPVQESALRQAGITPSISGASCGIRGKARELEDGMIFFLSNFQRTGPFSVTLRVKGKAPELFNPATGESQRIARYEQTEQGTKITLQINDRADSFFVIFRDQPTGPSVVSASAPVTDLDLYYNDQNELIAESEAAGTYTLALSDGTTRSVTMDRSPDPVFIKSPWKTEPNDRQGYSVDMSTRFNMPFKPKQGQRILLDLDNVEVMAKVTLNGKTFETLWMPPFTLDVTDALKTGRNDLTVRVTSTSQGKPKLGDDVRLRWKTKKKIDF